MNKFILVIISLVLVFSAGFVVFLYLKVSGRESGFLSPIGSKIAEGPKEKPLEKYSFENLAKQEFPGSEIVLEKVLKEEKAFSSFLFSYFSEGKKITGLANIPDAKPNQKLPVIVMLRGYVDQAVYETGVGTSRAGEVFASNGFITLAPDFLGFGGSDMPENNVFWERFNRPVQALNLISSVKSLSQADPEKIGIWAHSNGGQLALSILEITQKPIPATLWAPVSKPFPYSILYFTDEFDDQGKALRLELARLEEEYDVRKYSITDYFDQISAPIQIHQGTFDDSVPAEWSDELFDKLKEFKIDVKYYQYAGADHNMLGAWNQVVGRDLSFFKNILK